MFITPTEIRNEIKKLWPTVSHRIWITDPKHWCPRKERFEEFIRDVWDAKFPVEDRRWIDNLGDCDDYAKVFVGEVCFIRMRLAYNKQIPQDEWASWAVGYCMGQQFRGIPINHAVNICILEEGIHFFDAMEGRLWKASDKDSLYFVLI